MRFSKQQRFFLAAVCKHFHETGTWPTCGQIDMALRSHKGLDVAAVGRQLGPFMHHPSLVPQVGWDPSAETVMSVDALHTCQVESVYPALAEDLDAFMNVVRLCVEKCEADAEDAYITSADVFNVFGYSDVMLGKAFQLVVVEVFFDKTLNSTSTHNRGRSGGLPINWAFKLPRDIRAYSAVYTIDDYMGVRERRIAEILLSLRKHPPSEPEDYWELPQDPAIIRHVDPGMFDALMLLAQERASRFGLESQEAENSSYQQRRTRPKIFVSHSSKDSPFASKLVNDLNAAGAQAWMDVNDLGEGNFQQRISKALDDCEWFLLVLTHNALTSEWVKQEVDTANLLKNQGQIRNLIFVSADSVMRSEMPALWRVYQVFDGATDYATALTRTLKAVGLLGTA